MLHTCDQRLQGVSFCFYEYLRPELGPKNERIWKASCGYKGRHRPESKLYQNFTYNLQPANSSKHCAIISGWINNIIIIISRLPLPWLSSIDKGISHRINIILLIYQQTLFVNTIWTTHPLSRITWWVKMAHYLDRLNHAWGWFTKVLQFISAQSFLFVTTNWDHCVVVYLINRKHLMRPWHDQQNHSIGGHVRLTPLSFYHVNSAK